MKAHVKTAGNYEWIQENWEEIQKGYSGKFIAVVDHKVVHSTDIYTDLLDYLSQHRDQPDLIAVRIRPQDRVVLL